MVCQPEAQGHVTIPDVVSSYEKRLAAVLTEYLEMRRIETAALTPIGTVAPPPSVGMMRDGGNRGSAISGATLFACSVIGPRMRSTISSLFHKAG